MPNIANSLQVSIYALLRGRLIIVSVLFIVMLWNGSVFAALAITHVTAEPNFIDIDQQQQSTIRFRIIETAQVEINIYDANDMLTRHFQFPSKLKPGEHQWQWDGKDDHGQPVVPEAYYYTLRGTTSDEAVEYDLTDITGGDEVNISEVQYDKQKGSVSYALNYPARIFLRAQVSHGLILDTLLNSEIQVAGKHELLWAGKDVSGSTDISELNNLTIFGRGYRLPRNAIIVASKQLDSSFKPFTQSDKPARKRKARSKKTNEHFRHSRSECKDFTVLLRYQDADTVSTPVIRDIAEFRLDLLPEERNMIASQRFEVSFFIDYKLVHENEVSYAPYSWRLNPETLEPGEHVLTAVVVAYGSHIGSSSLKFKT